jgi:hypothetical protein
MRVEAIPMQSSICRRAIAWAALVALGVGGTATPGGSQAQPPADTSALPFFVGERLTYDVRTSRFGGSGKGVMRVDGPVDVRGTPTYLLSSVIETRVGLTKATNRSQSWLDPVAMASLRFRKRERSLVSSGSEAVEVFPEQRRWEAEGGRSGVSETDAPLDELSFIYFLRTVPLAAESTYRFDRHFDPARNPTTVRVVGRETVTTPAGQFATIVLEMRVKDPERYRGDGAIRINLTDDHCRLPVRIESRVPVAGTAVLTLADVSPRAHHARVAHAAGHTDR